MQETKIINPISTMESDSVCEKCGDTKIMEIELFGVKRTVGKMCRCEQEASEKRNAEQEAKDKQIRLERLKASSMMDNHFSSCTFGNFVIDKHNEKVYKLAKNYAEHWAEMKAKNIGFLFYGDPGTGKSFVSFCIANHLLQQLVPVIAISSIGILNRIKQTYNNFGKEAETQIIALLGNASLLVLDDLGAENNTEWSKEKLYEIIDSRYRLKRPMIVTTNLTKDQLKNKLTSADGVTRTYDRLIEMCTPIEIKGPSKRAKAAADKMEVIKKLIE